MGHTFTRSMLPGIVAAATLSGILQLPASVTLAVADAAITLVYLIAVWAFGFSGFERGLFGSYLAKTLYILVL